MKNSLQTKTSTEVQKFKCMFLGSAEIITLITSLLHQALRLNPTRSMPLIIALHNAHHSIKQVKTEPYVSAA